MGLLAARLRHSGLAKVVERVMIFTHAASSSGSLGSASKPEDCSSTRR